MSKHLISGEIFYPWTDIKDGRYSYFEKKYGKITLKRLEELVKEKVIESQEISVEDTPFTFTVYNEGDIMQAFGKHKFKIKMDAANWFG